MKETSEKVRPDDAEGLFNDSSFVVSYLDALLSSAPQMDLDFGEIHFVQRAVDSGTSASGGTGSVYENVINFEAERARIETRTLKSENDELKLKIARLVAQLNEVECSRDAMLAENSTLVSKVEALEQQIELFVQPRMQDNADIADDTPRGDHSAELCGVPAIETEEKSVLEEYVPVIPEPEIAVQPLTEVPLESPERDVEMTGEDTLQSNEKNILAEMFLDRMIISQPETIRENSRRVTEHNVVTFAHKHAIGDMPLQRSKFVSSVIKHHHVRKSDQPEKPLKAPSVPMPDAIGEPARKTEPMVEPVRQAVMDAAAAEELEMTVNASELLNSIDVDVDVEAAPAPKVVVRRNVRNYEAIQEEADSVADTKVHDIVL